MVGADVEADAVKQRLAGMIQRAGNLSPVMGLMGRHMMASTRTTFDVGGRPNSWPPLVNVEVAPKGSRGKGRTQGRARMGGPLVLTGDLRRSAGFTPEPKDLVVWDRPSNDVIKAPVHQYGARIPASSRRFASQTRYSKATGRPIAARPMGHGVRDIIIPPRPYLVFQREDLAYFRSLVSGFIRLGAASGGAA